MDSTLFTQNENIKVVELNFEEKKYICRIQIIDELISVNIILVNELKYKGYIFLEKIQTQIKAFFDYNINEIFEEITKLNSDNFTLVKEENNYKLKIKFIILKKEKNLFIDLHQTKNINLSNEELNNNYEKIIKQKERIIFELKEKIKLLEDQLKKVNKNEKQKEEIKKENNYFKIDNNNNLYKDFNIKLKDPIHILNNHKSSVYCLLVLNDGRLVSCSYDKSIIIYNKITYNPDLIINEHKDSVRCIIQLDSGILVSCSMDKTIKLFNIKGVNYETIQTLNYHTDGVFKIIEIKNRYLVSCSSDKSIIFYIKNNYQYIKDYQIPTKGSCYSVIQTKENEICYSEKDNNNICFYDLNERKIKSFLSNINKYNGNLERFIMIKKDLLLIPGENKISIVDINQYKVARIIEVPGSNWLYGVCILNEDMLLTGDGSKRIIQWKIEGDNLILISSKNNTHNSYINFLLNMGNGHIASGFDDKIIKIF